MTGHPPRRGVGRLGDLALTARVAVRGAGIADPRVLGEPFVVLAAKRAKDATEKYWHGTEGRAVNLHASGNGPLCLGATYHHHTH